MCFSTTAARIYHLDGQKSWKGARGKEGELPRRTKLDYDHGNTVSPINVFLSSCWRNECCGFQLLPGTGEAYGPVWRSASLPRSGHSRSICTELMPPPPPPTPLQPRHSGTGIKLSESDNQGRHLRPEIHRRMDNRNEATALRVPLADFEHNNCLTRNKYIIVTVAKCAEGYQYSCQNV